MIVEFIGWVFDLIITFVNNNYNLIHYFKNMIITITITITISIIIIVDEYLLYHFIF